jgi:hypothetical protein
MPNHPLPDKLLPMPNKPLPTPNKPLPMPIKPPMPKKLLPVPNKPMITQQTTEVTKTMIHLRLELLNLSILFLNLP